MGCRAHAAWWLRRSQTDSSRGLGLALELHQASEPEPEFCVLVLQAPEADLMLAGGLAGGVEHVLDEDRAKLRGHRLLTEAIDGGESFRKRRLHGRRVCGNCCQ